MGKILNWNEYYHKWLVSRGAIRHCSSRSGILSSCEVVTHSGPRRAGILLLRKWVWRLSGSCHDKHTQTEPWPGFMSLIHFQPPRKITIHISIFCEFWLARSVGFFSWFGSWGPFFLHSTIWWVSFWDGWWNCQNCQAGWFHERLHPGFPGFWTSLGPLKLWHRNLHINLILCGSSMDYVMLLGMSMDWLKEHVTANLAFNPKWLGVSYAFLQMFHPIQIRSLGSNRQLALPSVARFLRANSQAGQRGILSILVNGLVWKWGSQKSIG